MGKRIRISTTADTELLEGIHKLGFKVSDILHNALVEKNQTVSMEKFGELLKKCQALEKDLNLMSSLVEKYQAFIEKEGLMQSFDKEVYGR